MRELELVEVLVFADEDQRLGLTVVDGREPFSLRLEIREHDLGLAPVLEGQLALHAGVASRGECHDRELGAVEHKRLSDTQLCRVRDVWRAPHLARHGVLGKGVAQPRARIVGEPDVPLVPAAAVILVDDSPNHGKWRSLVASLGAELNSGAGRRHVRYDADAPEVDVMPNENRATEGTRRLDRARPAKGDFATTVGTGCLDGHAGWALGPSGVLRYGNTAIATLDHRRSRPYGSIAITPHRTPLLLSPSGLRCVAALEATHFDVPRAEVLAQPLSPWPLSARRTTEEVYAERPVLRKGMHR